MAESKEKKKGSIAGTWLWNLLVLILVLILVNVVGAKLNHQVPRIFGYSIFRITSGSMEPTIPTGMYILVKKTPAEEIQKGDIITFYSTDPSIEGMPNTHRVAAKPIRTARGLVFQTRGDANYISDEYYVAESRLIGRYCCNLTKLTELVDFFMTRGMLIVLLVIQGVSLLMMGASVKILEKNRKEREALKEENLESRMQALRQQAVEEYLKNQESGKNQGDGPQEPEKTECEMGENGQ